MIALLIVVIVSFAYCASSKKQSVAGTSLKDAFKNDFLIGTALNAPQIEEKDSQANALIIRQFNAITPENIMKAEVIHPEWNRYDFTLADKIVDPFPGWFFAGSLGSGQHRRFAGDDLRDLPVGKLAAQMQYVLAGHHGHPPLAFRLS